MRWPSVAVPLQVAVSLLGAACGFGGSSGDGPDGGAPDGPPLMPGETDLVIDSVAEWSEAAVMDGTFVSTAGGPGGSLEPIASLGGKLFVECDDDAGPYDGTWASHPMPNGLVRTAYLVPSFSQALPALTPNFVYWFSGEIRLESGAQKIAVATSEGSSVMGFVDVLARDGKTELLHCGHNTPCDLTTTAAGWYPIRMAWRHVGGGTSFDLRYSNNGGAPSNIDPARLRAPLVTAQHTGSRLEAFSIQRAFEVVSTAVMTDADKPMDLNWGASLFNLGTSVTYRNSAQLRIPEDGSYDFVVDANGGSSHRVWLDGEWLTTATLFDYIDDGEDPPPQTFTRQLTAGWHDLVAEGYDTRGNNGTVVITYGKTGGVRAPLPLAATRPVIGVAPQVATQTNQMPTALLSNTAVSRTLTIANLAAAAPAALGIDIKVTAIPRTWGGLQIRIVPPNENPIAVVFDSSQLQNNASGTVTASLSKATLGNTAKAQGDWRVEVIHAANAMLDNSNVVTEVEAHVYYAGATDVAGAKLVDPTTKYTRMIKLDRARELRNVLLDAIKPAGSDVRVEVATCTDEAGTTCQAALSLEELTAQKPTTQYAKLVVTFTSNGYAVPILNKLALRYLGDS